jgi:hypothetical protein
MDLILQTFICFTTFGSWRIKAIDTLLIPKLAAAENTRSTPHKLSRRIPENKIEFFFKLPKKRFFFYKPFVQDDSKSSTVVLDGVWQIGMKCEASSKGWPGSNS